MANPRRSRFWPASIAAALLSGILSVTAVCGSLFLYLSYRSTGYFPGNVTFSKGPDDLFTPVLSSDGYQEVFLLCSIVAYLIWLVMVGVLVAGIVKASPRLYVPWLVWSGWMVALCVFGIFHLLAYMYQVYQYVLAEYIVLALTVLITVPFSCVVYADFSSRHVKSDGMI